MSILFMIFYKSSANISAYILFIEFILFIEIYKQDFNIMNQEFILTTTGIARISFSVYKTVLFGYLIHFFFCHQPHPSWKCNNKNGTVTIYGGGIKFIWKCLLLLPKFHYDIMILYCVIFIYTILNKWPSGISFYPILGQLLGLRHYSWITIEQSFIPVIAVFVRFL